MYIYTYIYAIIIREPPQNELNTKAPFLPYALTQTPPFSSCQHPAMGDLLKGVSPQAPAAPFTPAAPPLPPAYTPPVRPPSAGGPSVFKGLGGGGIAKPGYGLREQYEVRLGHFDWGVDE